VEVLAPQVLQGFSQTADPSLAVDPENGDLLLSWGGEEGEWDLYFARSSDGAVTFGDRARVNDLPGDLYPHAEGAPRLVAGPGVVALFWNNRIEVEGRRFAASDLRFARSTDGGRSWTAARTLQEPIDVPGLPPRGNTFHGAVRAGDSTLVVAWLDGRERDHRRLERAVSGGAPLEEAARSPELHEDPDDPHDSDATVFAAVSHDLGATWEPSNRRVTGSICPCCRISLAATPAGEIVGSWRGHYEGSVRDPQFLRLLTEADPLRIHADEWAYPGCPHSGPGLDVDPGGTAHTAWYTGAEGRLGVYYARMDPGASSFAPPLPVVVGEPVGVAHPSLVALPDGGAVVATNVDGEGRRVIVLSGFDPAGDLHFQVEVPDSEGGTHPQLAALPDGWVVAAWTESRGGIQSVRLARIRPRGGS